MQLKPTKIEWCTHSWNPVTGCLHGCDYCYARRITQRFGPHGADRIGNAEKIETQDTSLGKLYTLKEAAVIRDASGEERKSHWPYGFAPTFHPYSLDLPKKSVKPSRIFVSSMGDLFGSWVPDDWIFAVFDACLAAPQHTYLFLTKNPARYLKLAKEDRLPRGDGFWYGSSATNTEMPAFFSEEHHTFASIEPILEPFRGEDVQRATRRQDWIILGAETGSRKEKVKPEKDWFADIVDAGVPVFMKDSLKPIWGEELVRQYPASMPNTEA